MTKHKEYFLFYVFYIIIIAGVIGYYVITTGFSFSGSVTEEFRDIVTLNAVSVMVYFWHIFLLNKYIKYGKRKMPWIKVDYVRKSKLLIIFEKIFIAFAVFLITVVLGWAFTMSEPGILLFVILPGSIFSSARHVIKCLNEELIEQETQDISL